MIIIMIMMMIMIVIIMIIIISGEKKKQVHFWPEPLLHPCPETKPQAQTFIQFEIFKVPVVGAS